MKRRLITILLSTVLCLETLFLPLGADEAVFEEPAEEEICFDEDSFEDQSFAFESEERSIGFEEDEPFEEDEQSLDLAGEEQSSDLEVADPVEDRDLVEEFPTAVEEQPVHGSTTFTYINPLYEHLYDHGQESTFEDASFTLEGKEVGSVPQYDDSDSAAVFVREKMKSREETITFKYSDSYDQKYAGDREAFENYLNNTVLLNIVLKAMEHTGVPTEGDYIAFQYAKINGCYEYEFVGKKYNGTFTIQTQYYSTAEQEEAVTGKMNTVLDDLNLAGKSDYEKIKLIYDYICKNVTYDYDHLEDGNYPLKYTAYGALINGTAVCQGYAVLLYRMLLESGIENRVVQGIGVIDGTEERHAWNAVMLDGAYYWADATWDSPDTPGDPIMYGCFLKGSNNFPDHIPDEGYEGLSIAGENYLKDPDPFIKCSASKLSLNKGKTKKVYVTIRKGDTISATSSDSAIAAVKIIGSETVYDPTTVKIPVKITAGKKGGTAVITLTTETGLTKTVKVTVPKTKTKSISLPKKTYTVRKGKNVKLGAKVSPANSDEPLVYSSANKKIATVDKKGTVKGIKAGSTTITVKSGSVKRTVNVKVTA